MFQCLPVNLETISNDFDTILLVKFKMADQMPQTE